MKKVLICSIITLMVLSIIGCNTTNASGKTKIKPREIIVASESTIHKSIDTSEPVERPTVEYTEVETQSVKTTDITKPIDTVNTIATTTDIINEAVTVTTAVINNEETSEAADENINADITEEDEDDEDDEPTLEFIEIDPCGGYYYVEYYYDNKLLKSDKVAIGTGITYEPLDGATYANGWDFYWTLYDNPEEVNIDEVLAFPKCCMTYKFNLQICALGEMPVDPTPIIPNDPIEPVGGTYTIDYVYRDGTPIKTDTVVIGGPDMYIPLDGSIYANGLDWYWAIEGTDVPVNINDVIQFAKYDDHYVFVLMAASLGEPIEVDEIQKIF